MFLNCKVFFIKKKKLQKAWKYWHLSGDTDSVRWSLIYTKFAEIIIYQLELASKAQSPASVRYGPWNWLAERPSRSPDIALVSAALDLFTVWITPLVSICVLDRQHFSQRAPLVEEKNPQSFSKYFCCRVTWYSFSDKCSCINLKSVVSGNRTCSHFLSFFFSHSTPVYSTVLRYGSVISAGNTHTYCIY